VAGVDTSEAALELARENATRLELDVRLRLAGVEAADETEWDLVVSNPPYVEPSEFSRLQPEVQYEPRAALVDCGLHEELARRARTTWLVLEVGDGQAAQVVETLRRLGYHDVRVTRDLAGAERVVEGRRA
jgi:release factor glutamine methyltransferase